MVPTCIKIAIYVVKWGLGQHLHRTVPCLNLNNRSYIILDPASIIALTTCSPTSTELAFLSCWASLLLTWLVLASEAIDGPHGTLLAVCIEPVEADEAGPAAATPGVDPGIPGAGVGPAEAANDADDVEFVVALDIIKVVENGYPQQHKKVHK